jgi:hypothetical protein
MQKKYIREDKNFLLESGVMCLEFLYNTLILAIVTDGTNKKYPNS